MIRFSVHKFYTLYTSYQQVIRFFFLFFPIGLFCSHVQLGIDRFFEEGFSAQIKNKRVGLITNHTGVDSHLHPTIDLFKTKSKLVAIFSPEHGITGTANAGGSVDHSKDASGIHIYSLHGETRRPTAEMLKDLDVLVYDIQEIGCRSYTYVSTLFYVMEEAAKKKIPVIVLDRPNPMGGIVVDGPMLKQKQRSFLGYVNVPYCHGMTVGELARFFNTEYAVDCTLSVVPMKGWSRKMVFKDTGLHWIPTSPYIPEPDTPFYYASTGILGGLSIVNIGIGYTLPFKVIGAPWINAKDFAHKLNDQHLPGAHFVPFHYKPFYGKYKDELCNGVKIIITNPHEYRPLLVQYMLIGLLKSLYPASFSKQFAALKPQDKTSFCKVNGNEEMLQIIQNEEFIAWKLVGFDEKERKLFLEKRKKYLMYQ